mmetsp:Transcript_1951/g.5432  ORF Transcript_1951/g.5432 Transcript_1951/m.5432 type:complete len:203 (+) Transcript_1951:155-763(+)
MSEGEATRRLAGSRSSRFTAPASAGLRLRRTPPPGLTPTRRSSHGRRSRSVGRTRRGPRPRRAPRPSARGVPVRRAGRLVRACTDHRGAWTTVVSRQTTVDTAHLSLSLRPRLRRREPPNTWKHLVCPRPTGLYETSVQPVCGSLVPLDRRHNARVVTHASINSPAPQRRTCIVVGRVRGTHHSRRLRRPHAADAGPGGTGP